MESPDDEERDTISITVRGAPPLEEQPQQQHKSKYDPNVTEGVVPISDEHWEVILKLYLRTYRGPHAEEELKEQLADYGVLRTVGSVARGRYVRYLPRGLVDVNLKRGGWVIKCSGKSVTLQDRRRQWRVLRKDNFIFVRDEDSEGAVAPSTSHRKKLVRLLAEEALYQDTKLRSAQQQEEPPPPPRLKANFM